MGIKKFLKRAYMSIGYRLKLIDFPEPAPKTPRKVLYNIGKVNMHSSHIDDLIPQAVTIGENFISSMNSVILAHDASLYNHIGKHRIEEVVIGNNVFLGTGVIVLPGVKIGDGAIVGAGAVVTKDVAPYTIVVGNPARYLCTVDDYIKKCEARGVLFDTPESFKKYYDNALSQAEINEFQQKYLESKGKRNQ